MKSSCRQVDIYQVRPLQHFCWVVFISWFQNILVNLFSWVWYWKVKKQHLNIYKMVSVITWNSVPGFHIITSFHIITDLSSAVFGEVMLKLASSLLQHHPLHIHYPSTIPTLAYSSTIKTPTQYMLSLPALLSVKGQGWWFCLVFGVVAGFLGGRQNIYILSVNSWNPCWLSSGLEYIWSSQLLKACPTLPELALKSFHIYHALMGADETWWGLAFRRIQLDKSQEKTNFHKQTKKDKSLCIMHASLPKCWWAGSLDWLLLGYGHFLFFFLF